MKPLSKIISPAVALAVLGSFAVAEDGASQKVPPVAGSASPAATGSHAPTADEFRSLQQAVEAQTKQVEALRQAVTQLTERLAAKEAAAGPSSPPAHSDPAPPAPPTPPSPAPAESHPEAPSDAAAGPQHTVAKGETLTSIAKHYKIGIADIEKVNKIADDRKLQIGQVLNIPSPKPSEPAPKKDNP